MGVFSFFKKSKVELTDEQKKWNKMWDLWVEGRTDSPYSELMTYQSEINNGGHDQYFFNIENSGNLQKEMAILKTVLPAKLRDNLQNAYSEPSCGRRIYPIHSILYSVAHAPWVGAINYYFIIQGGLDHAASNRQK